MADGDKGRVATWIVGLAAVWACAQLAVPLGVQWLVMSALQWMFDHPRLGSLWERVVPDGARGPVTAMEAVLIALAAALLLWAVRRFAGAPSSSWLGVLAGVLVAWAVSLSFRVAMAALTYGVLGPDSMSSFLLQDVPYGVAAVLGAWLGGLLAGPSGVGDTELHPSNKGIEQNAVS